VDHTLKEIQRLEDLNSLESIKEDHMEKTSNEDLEDQRKTETIGTN